MQRSGKRGLNSKIHWGPAAQLAQEKRKRRWAELSNHLCGGKDTSAAESWRSCTLGSPSPYSTGLLGSPSCHPSWAWLPAEANPRCSEPHRIHSSDLQGSHGARRTQCHTHAVFQPGSEAEPPWTAKVSICLARCNSHHRTLAIFNCPWVAFFSPAAIVGLEGLCVLSVSSSLPIPGQIDLWKASAAPPAQRCVGAAKMEVAASNRFLSLWVSLSLLPLLTTSFPVIDNSLCTR